MLLNHKVIYFFKREWAGVTVEHMPLAYLDPGERLDDPYEVLFQQVVIECGQVCAYNGVIPQF